MDIGLFLLGILGALLTVYLAKEEIIPEFRPLFDTSEKEIEVKKLQDHVSITRQQIDDLQAKLIGSEPLPVELTQRLITVIETSQAEIKTERERLDKLEREIKQSQFFSRGLGFFVYIVLGGVFGSLLANRVKVEGLSGDLPTSFQSIIIGATWTTFLSLIGFRLGRQRAENRIEAVKKETAETFEALKKELSPKVAEKVADAERREATEQPILAGEAARLVEDRIDRTHTGLQSLLDVTRSGIRKDCK